MEHVLVITRRLFDELGRPMPEGFFKRTFGMRNQQIIPMCFDFVQAEDHAGIARLGVGTALVAGYRRGGAFRLGAAAASAVLVVASLRQNWLSISDQLGNAR